MKTPVLFFFALFAPLVTNAGTSAIDPTNAYAYAANIGWINCRGDGTNGLVTGEFVCSGYIYSANCGWINMGSGTPANGIRYQNNSPTDFGINVQDYSASGITFEAKLRGFAYGANIGWINFADWMTGNAADNPRIDLATGKLRGYAYSANAGWINLGELSANVNVTTTAIAPGADTDGDGIPDAWELLHAGNLTTMNATTDSDHDGVLDKDEYLADTDPFDANDRMVILALVPPRQIGEVGPFMSDLTWTSKPSRQYSIEVSPNLIDGFSPLMTNIPPGSGTTTFNRFSDSTATKKFYRIVSKLPLRHSSLSTCGPMARPRARAMAWNEDDFVTTDRSHSAQSVREKVAGLLLKFFHTDPVASGWYSGGGR